MSERFDPERSLIIVNPQAAAGRVRRRWPAIEQALRTRLGAVPVVFTERPGHASELARDAVAAGCTHVLSLGGDGTNSEIVHGIMSAGPEPGAVCLGILPFGTGGDFRRALDGFSDFDEALGSLATAPERVVDVGALTFVDDDGVTRERFFLNLTSFGMGGLVDRIVNSSPKWLGGKASFYAGTVRALFRYRPMTVRLSVDGRDLGTHTILSVFVGNARHAGGGMCLTPEALLDDGLLDVVIVPELPLLRSLTSLGMLYKGTHVAMPEVTSARGARVEAEVISGAEALLDVDGEAPGRLPCTITVRPGAIRVIGVRASLLGADAS